MFNVLSAFTTIKATQHVVAKMSSKCLWSFFGDMLTICHWRYYDDMSTKYLQWYIINMTFWWHVIKMLSMTYCQQDVWWHVVKMSSMTYCWHVMLVGMLKCLLSVVGNMSFGRLGWHFLPYVGMTFSTCYQHVGACWGNMSFGGSWQRDMMPTFSTKLSPIQKTRTMYYLWFPISRTFIPSTEEVRELHLFLPDNLKRCIIF